MITIAAGVCFGILGAVFILNWWQDHLVRRAERRERRAERRERADWALAYQASLQPPPAPGDWLGFFKGITIFFMVFGAGLVLTLAVAHLRGVPIN